VGSRRVRTSGLGVFISCRKLTVCSRDGEKGEVSEELRKERRCREVGLTLPQAPSPMTTTCKESSK
jgi:hypothetical protein